MNLSTADNALLPKLVEAKVLCDSRIETSLSKVLVVTDSEKPYPTVSPDVVTFPMFTIAVIGGALSAYEPELGDDHDGVELYDGQENVAAAVVAQINHLCRMTNKVSAIVLVTCVPSLTTQGTQLSEILSQMVRVENQVQHRHRRLRVVSFLSVKLPDDAGEFVFMLDVPNCNKWLAENVLRLVDDDDEGGESPDDEPDTIVGLGLPPVAGRPLEVVAGKAYEELDGVPASKSGLPFKHSHDRRI